MQTTSAQFPEAHSKTGEFNRHEDAFRDWVKRDRSSEFAPERGRYHLYVSLACPWAHRTIILRELKGLEETIGMTVVDPVRDERGWAFRNGDAFPEDPVNGFSEAYMRRIRVLTGASPCRCSGIRRRSGSSATRTTISFAC